MPDAAPSSPDHDHSPQLSSPPPPPTASEAGGTTQDDISGVTDASETAGDVVNNLAVDQPSQPAQPTQTPIQLNLAQHDQPTATTQSTSGSGLDGSPLGQAVPAGGQVEVITRPDDAPPTQIIAPSPSRPATTTSLLSVINPQSPAPLSPASSPQPPSLALPGQAQPPIPPPASPTPAELAAPASPAAPATPSSPAPTEGSTKPVVPVAKKFTSSLSVNKQYLAREAEKAKLKATEKAKQTIAAKVALAPPNPNDRHPTPPTSSPATSHPRLLSGKISTATAPDGSGVYINARDVAAAAVVAKEHAAKRWNTPTPDQQAANATASAGATAEPKPAPAPAGPFGGMGPGGRPLQRMGGGNLGGGGGGWRSHAYGEAQRAPSFGGSDFPTAAEAAQEKNWRAQALVEQAQAKEAAEKQKAAAAAAQNATLLQGLDAFRGVHLDPNASHWDEMGDENDDFLDDTIEFGDGTQYKIIEEVKQEATRSDELRPPHSSLAAQLEKPLGRDESPGAPIERVERFKDDFNRRGGPADGGPPKALFNARDGKLEPYAGQSRVEKPPHIASIQQRRPSESASTRPGPPPMAWGKPAVSPGATRTVPEQDYPTLGAGPGSGRRMSNDHAGRRPSFTSPAVGERELPPHLRGNAPPPRPTPSAILSPPRPRQPSLAAPPPVAAQDSAPAPSAPVEAAAPVPTAPVVDIEELHRRELHAGAERARLRRQKEEEENDARKERARKKAQEMADKMDAEAAAKKAKEAPPPPPVPVKSPVVPNGTAATSVPVSAPTPAATVNSWRKPLVPAGPVQERPPPTHFHPPPHAPYARPTVVPASAAAAQSVGKTQPTQILARQGPPHLEQAQAQSTPPTTSDRDAAPHPQPRVQSSRPIVPVVSPAVPAPSPSPAVVGHARSPSDASERRGRTRTSSISSKVARSPTVGHTQDMTSLEAVMSRVKLEMANQEAHSPSPNGRETPAVEKAEHKSSKREARNKPAKVTEVVPVPIVRLPGKRAVPAAVAGPAESSLAAPALAGPKTAVLEVRLPSTLQVHRGRSDRLVISPAALGAHAAAAAGPPPPVPSGSRSPAFVRTDTREARASSPPPVWRRYSVKLSPARPRRLASHKKMAEFRDPRSPLPSLLDPLTWVPQLKGVDSVTLSRDEWLLPNWQKDKGPRAWAINLPKRRLPPRETFARRVGDDVQEAFETRRGEEDLFEKPAAAGGKGKAKAKEQGETAAERRASLQRSASVSGNAKGTRLAGGALTSRVEEVEEREVVEGVVVQVETVTVTSGLGGEEVRGKVAKELAAPGALTPTDARTGSERRLSISYTTTTTTTNEPSHATSPAPPPAAVSAAATQPFRAPLSPGWAAPTTSVLNPSTPGLWSAPVSSREARSRAVSHDPSTLARATSGQAAVNSLQGLVGPEEDDVTAALPQSMEALALGFRSDEGEAESVSHKAHGPRLSAAAPEFAAFQPRPVAIESSSVLGLTSGAGAAVAAQFPASGYPRQYGAGVGTAHSHARQGSSPAQFDLPTSAGYSHSQHSSLGHGHAHSLAAYGGASPAAEPAYLARPYSPAAVSPYSPVASVASVPGAQYGRTPAYAPQGYVHGREGYPGYASSPTATSAVSAAYGALSSSAASSPVQAAYYGAGYASRAPPAASTPTSYAAQSPVQHAFGSHPASAASAGQGGYSAVSRGGSYGAVGGIGSATGVGSVRGSTGARPVNVGPAGNGYGRPNLHATASLGAGGANYGAYGASAYGGGGSGSAPGSIHHSPAGGAARTLSAVGAGYGASPVRPGSGAGSAVGMGVGRDAFVSKPYVGGPSPVLMPAALPGRGYGQAQQYGGGGVQGQQQQQGYGQAQPQVGRGGVNGAGAGVGRAYW